MPRTHFWGRGMALGRAGGQLQLALNEGLKLQPKNVDLLWCIAPDLQQRREFFDALDDLNAANDDMAPQRADILVLRATATKYLENVDLARDNIELALKGRNRKIPCAAGAWNSTSGRQGRCRRFRRRNGWKAPARPRQTLAAAEDTQESGSRWISKRLIGT